MTGNKIDTCYHCKKEYPRYTDMYIGNKFYGAMANGARAIGNDGEFCSIECDDRSPKTTIYNPTFEPKRQHIRDNPNLPAPIIPYSIVILSISVAMVISWCLHG